MSRRVLFTLAVLAVMLAGRGAMAERLGGSYRGPDDFQNKKEAGGSNAADTGGGAADTAASSKGDTSSGGASSSEGAGGASGGGGDAGGGGSSGGGDAGGGGGSSSGGGDAGSAIGGSAGGGYSGGGGGGGDAGGGGGGGAAASGGGGGGGAGGGAPGGGGGKKASSSTQDQFYVASWFFEHNRERLIQRFGESMSHRIHIPLYSSASVFGMLPRDARQRSELTAEDTDRIFDILKKGLLQDNAAVVRDAAVLALGKVRSQAAVDLLKQHVAQESDIQVKQDTLLALGLTRSPDAVPMLLDTLSTDKGGKLTSFALLGLGLTQDTEKAAPAVLEYFTANYRKSVTDVKLEDPVASAAVALGMLHLTDATKPLAAALAEKKVPEIVRCYAAQALGRIGGDAARKALEDALSNKGGLEQERAAALALGDFPEAGVAKVLMGKEGIDKPDPLSAGFAAVSLGRVLDQLDDSDRKGAPAALQKLAMSPEKSPVPSQYANLALAYISGYDNADIRKYYDSVLREPKQNKDTRSSVAMASALGGLNSSQSALLKMAKDAGVDSKTRGYAALALGMVSQATAKDTAKDLTELFKSGGDQNLCRGALMGLGFVGDRNDVPFLIQQIDVKSEQGLPHYTRGAAVIALGTIKDGESIAAIQELTGKSDPKTRAFALAALGYLADKDEVPALTQLFENANFHKEFTTLKEIMHQL